MLCCFIDHHHLQTLRGLYGPEGLPGRHGQPSGCLWWWNREQWRPHAQFCWCRRSKQEGPGSVDLRAQPRAPRGAARWLHRRDCNCSPTGALLDPGGADPRGAGSGLRCHPGPATLPERLPQRRAHRPGGASSPARLPSCAWPAASAATLAKLLLTDTNIRLRLHAGLWCGGGEGAVQGATGGRGHLLPLLCVWPPDHRGC